MTVATFNRSQVDAGFSLLELLVVILIIGIAAGAVRLAVIDPDPLAEIQQQAEQLAYRIGQAQDRVLLSGVERGLLFLSDQVVFLQWREGDVMMGEPDILWFASEEKPTSWQGADSLRLSLTLDESPTVLETELPVDPQDIIPQVILLPSEDYTPAFQLTLEHEDLELDPIFLNADGFNRPEVSRER